MNTLYIKNMVCDRCIMAVRQTLDNAGIPHGEIRLGEVELPVQPDEQQKSWLKQQLEIQGFELLADHKMQLVEKIKALLIQLIHGSDAVQLQQKLSVYLAEQTGMDYKYLSALFSSTEGITIEKYVILQRVERAKELIMYNEHSLSEIADKLGYSSVHHLSGQFKQVTGLTPSAFKQLKENTRKPLDKLGNGGRQ